MSFAHTKPSLLEGWTSSKVDRDCTPNKSLYGFGCGWRFSAVFRDPVEWLQRNVAGDPMMLQDNEYEHR
jgi:hypothetical protein